MLLIEKLEHDILLVFPQVPRTDRKEPELPLLLAFFADSISASMVVPSNIQFLCSLLERSVVLDYQACFLDASAAQGTNRSINVRLEWSLVEDLCSLDGKF